MSDRQRRVRADWGQIQSTGRDLEGLAVSEDDPWDRYPYVGG